MTDASKDLRGVLEADAQRRTKGVIPPTERIDDVEDHVTSREVRFRLVNTLPRETRPLFAALRTMLAPYGYTLSPLHPAHDLSRPLMQTDLGRISPEEHARFAPLVFELQPGTTRLRVYVRQFGGRPAPDFAERSLDLDDPDRADLEQILRDYVICMLDVPRAAAA